MVVALVIPTCRSRTKINRRTMAPVGVVDRQMRLLIEVLFRGMRSEKFETPRSVDRLRPELPESNLLLLAHECNEVI